ncbi:hypothetical protein Mgra_00007323 [Meloidogyne graminicola]|uniref:Glycoside hydrolase family 2 catalytic domain-containing protein n=1 Tax=Meloidogyne graminicola TaxID=189291 RepID=A0A8S9ZIV3_9BILA|nr:hypothetical protein Mgra_00007323 [Meloidogyne graminicola]
MFLLYSILLLFHLLNKASALDKITISGQQILVNGKPFILNGAAGNIRYDLLKQLGGTVIRTYGDEIDQIIGPASQAGLKVVAGFWMGQVSQGYVNYKNQDQKVNAQNEKLKNFVLKYKDHPAVICWGIGNEVEFGAASSADTIPVWKAIDQAAKLVRTLDPNHPTMAVLADVGEGKAKEFVQYVSNIQILGVNCYGSSLPSIAQRARTQGWNGPLVIAETGPIGHWQAQVTPWSASIEPSSDAKAIDLDKYMTLLKGKVQGTIIFYWGTKIEATPTWHSFLLPFSNNEYERTSEVLAKQWGGKLNNRAPRITSFNFQNGKYGIKWNKGDTVRASLSVTDPDRDSINVVWSVLAERTDTIGANFTSILNSGSSAGVTINTNSLASGAYRLYMAALDNKGAAATANLPFYVN